jgi:hypothetical protein
MKREPALPVSLVLVEASPDGGWRRFVVWTTDWRGVGVR